MPNFKRIKFISTSQLKSSLLNHVNSSSNEGKAAKEFYESITLTPSSQKDRRSRDFSARKHPPKSRSSRDSAAPDICPEPVQFFRLIECGKLIRIQKAFEACTSSRLEALLNGQDAFGWSGLHVAVASYQYEIAAFLVLCGIDQSLRNRAAQTAWILAHAISFDFNRFEFCLSVLAANERFTSDSYPSPNSSEAKSFCSLCNIYEDEISRSKHELSIVHKLNESVSAKDSQPKVKFVSHQSQPLCSKGHQLLMRAGWDGISGLGKVENGRLFPIKAVKKEDRKCIGFDKINATSALLHSAHSASGLDPKKRLLLDKQKEKRIRKLLS